MNCMENNDINDNTSDNNKKNTIKNLKQFEAKEINKLNKIKKKIVLELISESLKLKKDQEYVDELKNNYKKCNSVKDTLQTEVKTLIKRMED